MRRNEWPLVAICVLIVLWLLLARALGAQAQILYLQKPFAEIQYSPALRGPVMIEWIVRPYDLKGKAKRANWRFRIDPEVPKPRATTDDYTNSGYQRGHMCPAADRTSSIQLMKSTFLLSNVCPQAPSLNLGAWKQSEQLCRLGAITYGACTIRVAPIYFNRDTIRIGKHRIAVPHAFFKVAWCSERQRIIGMWFVENK